MEQYILLAKKPLSDTALEKFTALIVRTAGESIKSLDKSVWFMINEHTGKYYITIFYDNDLNRANGEDL